MPISLQQRRFEILAVILTGAGKFLFINYLDQKLLFIAIAITFWITYISYRAKTQKGILAYWGFTKKNFGKTFKPLGIAGACLALLFMAYAIYKEHFYPNWHLLVILLLYPAWGTIQQFLMMPLIGGNLKDGLVKWPDTFIVCLTATAFAAVHLPNIPLTIATFFLGLVYAFLFLKHRNLWPLGIFHGVLGALFYFFVLNRDPWLEVFGG